MAIDVIQLNKTVRNISPRLHSEWWKKLDLENWKDLATTNDLVEQRLDNAILSRFGLEHFWLTEDLEIIQRWLSVINKLPVLLVATGLITQNCPDYIWDSQYRKLCRRGLARFSLNSLLHCGHTQRIHLNGCQIPCYLKQNLIRLVLCLSIGVDTLLGRFCH